MLSKEESPDKRHTDAVLEKKTGRLWALPIAEADFINVITGERDKKEKACAWKAGPRPNSVLSCRRHRLQAIMVPVNRRGLARE
jgi:hypothetical protein